MLLKEVVALTGKETIEDLDKRLEACRNALRIVNKMPADDPDRLRYLRMVFSNLNVVSAAILRMEKPKLLNVKLPETGDLKAFGE